MDNADDSYVDPDPFVATPRDDEAGEVERLLQWDARKKRATRIRLIMKHFLLYSKYFKALHQLSLDKLANVGNKDSEQKDKLSSLSECYRWSSSSAEDVAATLTTGFPECCDFEYPRELSTKSLKQLEDMIDGIQPQVVSDSDDNDLIEYFHIPEEPVAKKTRLQ